MQNSVSAKNQVGNDGLVSPEMRLRIRELKRELDECDYRLSLHLGLTIHGMRPFQASHMIRTLETLD